MSIRLLRARGDSLAKVTAKTGIPKTSLHRYRHDQSSPAHPDQE
jgi:hypothetical protein